MGVQQVSVKNGRGGEQNDRYSRYTTVLRWFNSEPLETLYLDTVFSKKTSNLRGRL